MAKQLKQELKKFIRTGSLTRDKKDRVDPYEMMNHLVDLGHLCHQQGLTGWAKAYNTLSENILCILQGNQPLRGSRFPQKDMDFESLLNSIAFRPKRVIGADRTFEGIVGRCYMKAIIALTYGLEHIN